MRELIFAVEQEADGGFVATCLTVGIFSQGDSWDELCGNVRQAIAAYCFDRHPPGVAHLLCEWGSPW